MVYTFFKNCFWRQFTHFVIHSFISANECTSLSLTNGLIVYSSDITPEFEIGTVATHSCDAGFALVGGMTRTCLGDNQVDIIGVWSGSAPTCERNHFKINFLNYSRLLTLYLEAVCTTLSL